MNNQTQLKYYCVFIREDKRYISLAQFRSREEAEKMRERVLSRYKSEYTPSNLRVMTPAEVGQQFGTDWVRVHTAYS